MPKCIININDNHWRACVSVKGTRKVKIFNFSKNGGKRESLKKAVAWRDKRLEANDLIHRLDYKVSPHSYLANSSHYFIGVYMTKNIRNEKEHINWTTRYSVGGIEYKRHFSINVYGYERAFQMACKLRYQYCGKIRMLKSFKPRPNSPWIWA